MNNPSSRLFLSLAVVGLAIIVAPRGGWAAVPLSDKEVVKKECGACHYAYARDWLPAYSWKQILEHLDDHFGENAMLDDKTRQRIESYMVGSRSTAVPIRITDTDWWVGAHGGDSIKTYAQQNGFTVANCEKCHR